jgi:hypothetical protein
LSNTVCFLDIDGVIVKQGTRDFLPDARAKVTALCEIYQVYFFSCWAFTDDDRRWLAEMFPKAKGCIPKPYAEHYFFIDDKLDLPACDTHL